MSSFSQQVSKQMGRTWRTKLVGRWCSDTDSRAARDDDDDDDGDGGTAADRCNLSTPRQDWSLSTPTSVAHSSERYHSFFYIYCMLFYSIVCTVAVFFFYCDLCCVFFFLLLCFVLIVYLLFAAIWRIKLIN